MNPINNIKTVIGSLKRGVSPFSAIRAVFQTDKSDFIDLTKLPPNQRNKQIKKLSEGSKELKAFLETLTKRGWISSSACAGHKGAHNPYAVMCITEENEADILRFASALHKKGIQIYFANYGKENRGSNKHFGFIMPSGDRSGFKIATDILNNPNIMGKEADLAVLDAYDASRHMREHNNSEMSFIRIMGDKSLLYIYQDPTTYLSKNTQDFLQEVNASFERKISEEFSMRTGKATNRAINAVCLNPKQLSKIASLFNGQSESRYEIMLQSESNPQESIRRVQSSLERTPQSPKSADIAGKEKGSDKSEDVL